MSNDEQAQEALKELEKSMIEMFEKNSFALDFKHLGEGKYQFTKDGEPCVFDQESEFRLRIFLNSFHTLTNVNAREK